ncbi:hypothetical protein [Planctopirus hydrillae]|uniref:Uncharacterized protein n=1 Tax=Planctopirus hydrillae TaxID=1841610 RepID=A0A1C3EU56_9PLAN|nr:hypothetical protein [Planctopirus hydrillae]ODA36832.1 hypothetical protein A6X21_01805 [Planctopirus hydrillae]
MTQAWPTYPAPRKLALVVSCVDYRLLDDIVSYLHLDNMTNRYYHFAIAGTALSLVEKLRKDDFQPPEPGDVESYERANIKTESDLMKLFCAWKRTFFDQVKAGLILTKQGISDIYIIQHENCGAFRIYLNKDIETKCCGETDDHQHCANFEIELHQWYAKEFKRQIQRDWNGFVGKLFDDQWQSSKEFGIKCEAADDQKAQTKRPDDDKPKAPEIHLLYMNLRGEMLNLEEWEPDPKTYKVKEKKKSKKSKDAKKSE